MKLQDVKSNRNMEFESENMEIFCFVMCFRFFKFSKWGKYQECIRYMALILILHPQ